MALHQGRANFPTLVRKAISYLSLGLSAALANAGDYAPALVTQTNRQVPLVFALPVTRFEVDVGDLAARATRMALARLTGVEASDRVEWVQPMLADRMTTGEEHRIDPDQKRSDGSQPWIERDARKLAPSS